MRLTRYVLGGLVVRSELSFPSVPEAASSVPAAGAEGGPAAPGLQLVLEPRLERLDGQITSWLVERTLPGASAPYLRVAGDPARYVLAHARGIDLEITHGTRVAITHLDPALDLLEVEHLLLDQLLPLVIGRLGRLSLHGSAVAWGDQGVAFLGPSGAGKSTTAAFAVERAGARLVADDQVVLEPEAGRFRVHPGYPSVRLWDDSAASLFGRVADGARKHRVALTTAGGPVPLAALVLLERGGGTAVAPVRTRDAITGIAPHVDRLDPTDRAALRQELELLSRLAETTRVVRAVLADDLDQLAAGLAAVRAAIAI